MNENATITQERTTNIPNISANICNYHNQDIEDSSNYMMHFHHSAEILLVEHGQLEVSSLDCSYTLNSNDFIFINCDVLHRTKITQYNTTVHMIQFEPFAFSSNALQQETLYRFINQGDQQFYKANNLTDITMFNAIGEIITEYSIKKTSYDLVVKSDILRILAHLDRKKVIFNTLQNEAQKKALEKLSPILEYVFSNYCTDISLDDLCVKFAISKNYFCKQFKLITGKTFCDFLTHLKIKHAIQLLNSPEKYITDIAYECGFNSLSYFNKTFKKITGYSPRKYRVLL